MGHGGRKHALLSASGAERWLNCTPSAQLGDKIEDGPESTFAAEGTLAHEFAELELRAAIHAVGGEVYAKKQAELRGEALYTDEMEGEVEKYVNFVMEEFGSAKKTTPDAILMIENVVDLTDFIDEGFGTCDSIIISDGTMRVNDLKYGKGIKVSAENNSQLKLYGLGALTAFELLYDIKHVELNIMQPRLDHISSWRISADALKQWGEFTVKHQAGLAYKGEGEMKAGDWCRWCKVKPRCRALAELNLEIAKHDFADPNTLSDKELLDVRKKIPMLQDWANSVGVYVLDEALKGKKWEGLKLVEGRSNRIWSDAKGAATTLSANYKVDEYINAKLKGIGGIEKLVGKKSFPDKMGKFVIKPQGKPTLVDEKDKRPAMGIQQAKQDFKN